MRHHSPLPATSSIPPKKHQETLKTYLLLRGIAWPCGAHPNPCESTGEFLLGQRFASWFGALFGGCRLFLAPLLATRRGCFWLNHLHPLVRAAELLVLRLEAHNLHLVLALLDALDVLELHLELHDLGLQLVPLPLELLPVPLQRLELLPCLHQLHLPLLQVILPVLVALPQPVELPLCLLELLAKPLLVRPDLVHLALLLRTHDALARHLLELVHRLAQLLLQPLPLPLQARLVRVLLPDELREGVLVLRLVAVHVALVDLLGYHAVHRLLLLRNLLLELGHLPLVPLLLLLRPELHHLVLAPLLRKLLGRDGEVLLELLDLQRELVLLVLDASLVVGDGRGSLCLRRLVTVDALLQHLELRLLCVELLLEAPQLRLALGLELLEPLPALLPLLAHLGVVVGPHARELRLEVRHLALLAALQVPERRLPLLEHLLQLLELPRVERELRLVVLLGHDGVVFHLLDADHQGVVLCAHLQLRLVPLLLQLLALPLELLDRLRVPRVEVLNLGAVHLLALCLLPEQHLVLGEGRRHVPLELADALLGVLPEVLGLGRVPLAGRLPVLLVALLEVAQLVLEHGNLARLPLDEHLVLRLLGHVDLLRVGEELVGRVLLGGSLLLVLILHLIESRVQLSHLGVVLPLVVDELLLEGPDPLLHDVLLRLEAVPHVHLRPLGLRAVLRHLLVHLALDVGHLLLPLLLGRRRALGVGLLRGGELALEGLDLVVEARDRHLGCLELDGEVGLDLLELPDLGLGLLRDGVELLLGAGKVAAQLPLLGLLVLLERRQLPLEGVELRRLGAVRLLELPPPGLLDVELGGDLLGPLLRLAELLADVGELLVEPALVLGRDRLRVAQLLLLRQQLLDLGPQPLGLPDEHLVLRLGLLPPLGLQLRHLVHRGAEGRRLLLELGLHVRELPRELHPQRRVEALPLGEALRRLVVALRELRDLGGGGVALAVEPVPHDLEVVLGVLPGALEELSEVRLPLSGILGTLGRKLLLLLEQSGLLLLILAELEQRLLGGLRLLLGLGALLLERRHLGLELGLGLLPHVLDGSLVGRPHLVDLLPALLLPGLGLLVVLLGILELELDAAHLLLALHLGRHQLPLRLVHRRLGLGLCLLHLHARPALEA
mmetsp:Transcript_24317/g.61281  ORF Transcript_24317/g.61281 Transcript_24317/m.61281 type:complete len:1125 (-) Transcript_24317:1500-4874(-)